jgi:hypothetical protein
MELSKEEKKILRAAIERQIQFYEACSQDASMTARYVEKIKESEALKKKLK